MANLTRRTFLAGSAALAATQSRILRAAPALIAPSPALDSRRILVGSDTNDGILAFQWDPATGSLVSDGIAAKVSQSTWIALSPDRQSLYVACELEEFEGKPTGAVASYHLDHGKLTALSAVSSTGRGTCHLSPDNTGKVILCANYTGGSAASFLSSGGKLSQAVWSEHYPGYSQTGKDGKGPVPDRQEAAHAHFASFSPDNRFAYINDLGGDVIHIYTFNPATGKLTPAATHRTKPGDGPRTLHFHPNGKIAYCMNELNSTVTVLKWSAADGRLQPIQTVPLLPEGMAQVTKDGITNTGCDTVLTRDGKFAYFANRGSNFIMAFHVDTAPGGNLGKLTPLEGNPRTSSGGATPRNFTLDPTERWMLVANQKSSNLSVFARDPKTGAIASEGKNTPAATPMCIVFV
jgi:6-phosphogluconolactonase